MTRVKVGVLASGSGTNLGALIEAGQDEGCPFEIVIVASDKPRAFALQRAKDALIPAAVVPRRQYNSREEHDAAMVGVLKEYEVEWVALAGFMRIVSSVFLDAYPERILNIHPALLPSFKGLHAHEQALAAGVRVSGATVHFVDDGTDTGPIICQEAVPVYQDDSLDALKERILKVEHQLYPQALRWAVEGKLLISGSQVLVQDS